MFTEAARECVDLNTDDDSARVFRRAWFNAWMGTAAAGGAFGMLAGFLPGLLVGVVIAAALGAPVILSFAILTWAFFLEPFTVLLAAIAGGCTGLLSTAIVWDPIFATGFHTSLVLATIIGAFGSRHFAGSLWTEHRRTRAGSASESANNWRFSLRDLFVRFTVVAVLIACWALVVNAYLDEERASASDESLDGWGESNW